MDSEVFKKKDHKCQINLLEESNMADEGDERLKTILLTLFRSCQSIQIKNHSIINKLPLRPHTCRHAHKAHICIGASLPTSSNLKKGTNDL